MSRLSTALLLLPLVAGCSGAEKAPSSGDGEGDTAAPEDTGGDTADSGADPEDTADTADSGDTADPDDTADTADSGETGDPEETGDPVPAESWPASSVCLGADIYGTCQDGVEAAGWTGGSYLWATDALGSESAVTRDGAELFTVETSGWHVPWGLAVAPDGDVFVVGSTLGPAQMVVGSDIVSLPYTYNRFTVKVSPAGEVRWSATFEGISAERTLAAPTADGGAILVGELFSWDAEIGGFVVPGTAFNEGTLVAGLGPDGAWLWAGKVPDSYPSPIGELRLDAIRPGAGSDVEIHGTLHGEITVGADTLACPTSPGCVAYVTMAADGTFLAIAAK